jgi:hypothetical protein
LRDLQAKGEGVRFGGTRIARQVGLAADELTPSAVPRRQRTSAAQTSAIEGISSRILSPVAILPSVTSLAPSGVTSRIVQGTAERPSTNARASKLQVIRVSLRRKPVKEDMIHSPEIARRMRGGT